MEGILNERSQRAQWHQRKLKPNKKIGHLQPSESLPSLWLFFQFIFDIANFEIFKPFKIKILQSYDIIDLTKRKQNCCDCCAKFEPSNYFQEILPWRKKVLEREIKALIMNSKICTFSFSALHRKGKK